MIDTVAGEKNYEDFLAFLAPFTDSLHNILAHASELVNCL
jgi:hypothetical protein